MLGRQGKCKEKKENTIEGGECNETLRKIRKMTYRSKGRQGKWKERENYTQWVGKTRKVEGKKKNDVSGKMARCLEEGR